MMVAIIDGVFVALTAGFILAARGPRTRRLDPRKMRCIVRSRDLSGFVARLEAQGAPGIELHLAHPAGRIEVEWRPAATRYMRSMIACGALILSLATVPVAALVVLLMGR